jgi:replicative DNA helicase
MPRQVHGRVDAGARVRHRVDDGGKTAFLLPSVIAAGNSGHRFRIYSLDMDAASILLRLAAQQHKIPGKVTSCRAIDAECMDKIGETAAWLMAHGSISEASMSPDELVHDAIAYRDTYDILFIDTFQSLRIDDCGKRMSPYDRTCYAINRLKELKKVIRKPIICTAQAKDPPDRHEAAKGNVTAGPTLNDAEGARRITQEAQQMIAVWPVEYPADKSCGAKIKLAKSQRGIVGSWDCRWDAIVGRFVEESANGVQNRYGYGE